MIKRVIAVDPGKATGIAVFTWIPGEEPILVWSGEVNEEEFGQTIEQQIGGAMNPFHGHIEQDVEVVCESFTINAETIKKSQAPFSLELIGVLKYIVRQRHAFVGDKTITFQKPADAKSVFPNTKLQKLGYWHVGGEGHANDAIRHGLLYLASQGWVFSRLLD